MNRDLIVYFFQEGIPADFQPDFDLGIFHQRKHMLLQAGEGMHSFSIVDPTHKQIFSLIHFHFLDGIAMSPLRSPYGSYLFSPKISESTLQNFVAEVEARLQENGIKTVILKNAPEAYAPMEYKLLQRVLFKLDYQLHREEISAVIPVTDQSFQSKLHRSEKKRLRKCRENGFVFGFASNNHLPEIYDFLKTCKEDKGYEISMTLDQLTEVSSSFPTLFLLSQVMYNGERVAANISVKVNEMVLYNFYHDHQRTFNSFSPVVLLNEGLYQYCHENKFHWLDLGTSMLQGEINSSLLTFKLRLGAQPSRKLTFIKNFS